MNPIEPVNQIEIDARGVRCPLPVIRLAAAARDAPVGTQIIVLATDPAARHDIPAWCRMRNHELQDVTELQDVSQELDVTELQDVSELPEVTNPSEADSAAAEGAQPAYLRFVVVVRPQPSKAAGGGSGRERSSRAM